MRVRPIRTGLACLMLLSAIRPAFAGGSASEERFPLRPVRYELDLQVDFEEETISGTARLTLRNPSSSPATRASLILYRLLTVRGVEDGAGNPISFTQRVVAFEDEPRRQVNHVVVSLPTPLPPSGDVVLQLEYGGYLAGYVETGSLYIKDRVDESFTILRDDAIAYPTVGVPSARASRAAGLPEYDYLARITVPKSHVVANGGLLVERTERDGRATYVYRNIKPAWRMDFAIARYGLLERDGFKVFHLPADAGSAERILDSARAVRASYTKRFGPLPDASSLAIIEIPDGWGSQADVTSILQSAAAFKDAGRVGELYHEVSHLWNVRATDPPSCRWNEGLATFLEELSLEQLDGKVAVLPAARRTAERLLERAKSEPRLRSVPMIDYGKKEMTGFSYPVGMLMFHTLYEVAGPDRFDRIVGGFFKDHRERGASTEDFVRYARFVAGPKVEPLFRDWLYTTRWLEILSSGAKIEELPSRYQAASGSPPGECAGTVPAIDGILAAFERHRLVLAKKHTALLVIGGHHVIRTAASEPRSPHPGVGDLLAERHPGLAFAVFAVGERLDAVEKKDCHPTLLPATGRAGRLRPTPPAALLEASSAARERGTRRGRTQFGRCTPGRSPGGRASASRSSSVARFRP